MNYKEELEIMGKRAKKASLALSILSCRVKNRALEAMGAALEEHTEEILKANEILE